MIIEKKPLERRWILKNEKAFKRITDSIIRKMVKSNNGDKIKYIIDNFDYMLVHSKTFSLNNKTSFIESLRSENWILAITIPDFTITNSRSEKHKISGLIWGMFQINGVLENSVFLRSSMTPEEASCCYVHSHVSGFFGTMCYGISISDYILTSDLSIDEFINRVHANIKSFEWESLEGIPYKNIGGLSHPTKLLRFTSNEIVKNSVFELRANKVHIDFNKIVNLDELYPVHRPPWIHYRKNGIVYKVKIQSQESKVSINKLTKKYNERIFKEEASKLFEAFIIEHAGESKNCNTPGVREEHSVVVQQDS